MEELGIIEHPCPHCGNNLSYKKRTDTGNEFGICTKCDKLTYSMLGGYHTPTVVHCPFCNSSDCKKISDMSKAASAAIFGVLALGKISKTWHCNSCGSNFG